MLPLSEAAPLLSEAGLSLQDPSMMIVDVATDGRVDELFFDTIAAASIIHLAL
jgi:hypothetical protein